MKALYSIFSFSLIFLVVVSSSNISIGLHICGGEVKNTALFTKAKSCEHSELPPCHRLKMESCCSDEFIEHEPTEFKNENIVVERVSAHSFVLLQLPTVVSEVLPRVDLSPTKFLNYDTPIRKQDLIISNQIFLI